MNSPPVVVLQIDPTPRPVSTYAELWGKDPKTLNAWCVKGWIPGAFKHPSGEWFVNPLALINWSNDAPPHPEPASPSPTTAAKGKQPERLKY